MRARTESGARSFSDRNETGKISGLGQSRHFDRTPMTSGLPPTPDILSAGRHVSNVP